MAAIYTDTFYTPRETGELKKKIEQGFCPFCENFVDWDDSEQQAALDSLECPYCDMPLLDVLGLGCAMECFQCKHLNQLPKPLDADMKCQKCGTDI